MEALEMYSAGYVDDAVVVVVVLVEVVMPLFCDMGLHP